ncbi:peptide ABC transporter [Achromobacter sp. DMS1]|uniref:ABC transporter substrate-binding protein n=1 Tax=Achromobacter sp. DMS1 TaxID=1688405 RepID=UPI00069ED59A|nr:ABC transporter substrate-binding protein [Achromobacter sp. DMS1]KOF53551.1 peptide ABC transporter [Achromobacter sp. DMS1]
MNLRTIRRGGLKRLLLAGAVGLAALSVSALSAQPVKGGAITVATIGEPPTLDPMISTADLVSILTQHVFETLYTFDAKWNLTPLLAEKLPEISPDGLVYTIALRQGIKFHDGSDMDASDVLASLERWTAAASRGTMASRVIAGIDAPDARTVRITLKQPYAPLTALLAMTNSAAVILPKEKIEPVLKEFVGTGPYQLKARVPDQYIQLTRFDGYRQRAGEPDGYGGARKQYADEIRFVPVANANTRAEAAAAGQFDYVDSLPVEAMGKLEGSRSEAVLLKPFGWPRLVLNTKAGIMSNLAARRAVQLALNEEDMLYAAFGNKDFYKLNGDLYPEGYPWATSLGGKVYNQGDAAGAKKLLDEAGIKDRKIRILTSQQYEFHYKMALVAAEYLKAAGFTVDMQVVDWATLTQRRQNPAVWDIFITHSVFLPEPALIDFPSRDAPGWWDTPRRAQVMDAFNQARTQEERVKRWADVQQAVYDEVPFVKVGDFNALAARSPALQGFTPSAWPYFWNAWKAAARP